LTINGQPANTKMAIKMAYLSCSSLVGDKI